MKFFKKNNSIPNARLYFAEVVGENSEDETKALIVDKKKEKIQRSTIRPCMFILITGCNAVILRTHYTWIR